MFLLYLSFIFIIAVVLNPDKGFLIQFFLDMCTPISKGELWQPSDKLLLIAESSFIPSGQEAGVLECFMRSSNKYADFLFIKIVSIFSLHFDLSLKE